jgi:quinolinate synthase
VPAEDLVEWKRQYPGRPVVLYVNTSAAAKAEADVCCTSANADLVVNSLSGAEVLFGPGQEPGGLDPAADGEEDHSLGRLLPCPPGDSAPGRAGGPGQASRAVVWAHPECRLEVLDLADRVLSTGGMVREAAAGRAGEVIVATECGMLHRWPRTIRSHGFFR